MKFPAPERYWSTWRAGRPAEMFHLPLGVSVRPFAYAASLAASTWFPPGPAVRLGEHALDASTVQLTLSHAGTTLGWDYRKDDPETLAGHWRTLSRGEWGLRFWVCICLASEDGSLWRFEPETGLLTTEVDRFSVAVACRQAPLLITAHGGPDDLVEEFGTYGYWCLRSRATEGRFMALRFNLEEMPDNAVAVAVAGSRDAASRTARLACAAEPPARTAAAGPLAAVRDIMAWNTVWDAANARPYTTCSRSWDVGKFGGFGIWLTDTAVNALLHSLFGEEQAWENLDCILAGQTQAGNFPCLLTGNDSWIDRSQPPLVSLIVWMIYVRTRARLLLERFYEPLSRNHRWWWENRDGNGNAILEYGSSRVGNGLYLGTKLAAKNESFMDNSPVHDEARWIADVRTLDCEDVGLNCLIALDAEMLGLIATELGRETEAEEHRTRSLTHRDRVSSHFWDASRRIFANRLWNGTFAASLAPTSFFPLLVAAADDPQSKALTHHLHDARMFGGSHVLPSVSRRDRAYRDNVYWRGRIWPILNWLVWLGLKRAGLESEAASLVAKGKKLFDASWRQRHAPENFNAETGEGGDQPDTDSFYSWTALLPFMEMSARMDFDPWHGWCLVNDGRDFAMDAVMTPAGPLAARHRKGRYALLRNGRSVIETTVRGRIAQVRIDGERMTFVLPSGVKPGNVMRVAGSVATARQAERGLDVEEKGGRSTVSFAPTAGPETVELVLRSPF
jgi:putative isomerase